MKRRILIFASVLAAALAATATRAGADVLSDSDKTHFRAALEAAVDHGAWERALRFAAETKDPLARKVLRWLSLSDGSSGASFAEITAFMAENPDWPRQVALSRRAEEAMNIGVSHAEVLAWFKNRAPVSPVAMVRLAEAQWQTGKKAEAQATIRKAWIDGNFGSVIGVSSSNTRVAGSLLLDGRRVRPRPLQVRPGVIFNESLRVEGATARRPGPPTDREERETALPPVIEKETSCASSPVPSQRRFPIGWPSGFSSWARPSSSRPAPKAGGRPPPRWQARRSGRTGH